MGSYAIAYWSMPAGAARKFFERIIRELAMRFDAPAFDPHLTLFVAPEGSRAPREVLGEVMSPDFVLVAREIGWSEKFTETLFVRFERNQRLLHLVEAIRKSSGSEQYQIDPHLSLIYKKLPAKTKRALAEEIQLPGDPGLIYSDEDVVDATGGRHDPKFKPGWSPDPCRGRASPSKS